MGEQRGLPQRQCLDEAWEFAYNRAVGRGFTIDHPDWQTVVEIDFVLRAGASFFANNWLSGGASESSADLNDLIAKAGAAIERSDEQDKEIERLKEELQEMGQQLGRKKENMNE